jgi:hypothetical protein
MVGLMTLTTLRAAETPSFEPRTGVGSAYGPGSHQSPRGWSFVSVE